MEVGIMKFCYSYPCFLVIHNVYICCLHMYVRFCVCIQCIRYRYICMVFFMYAMQKILKISIYYVVAVTTGIHMYICVCTYTMQKAIDLV
jgi:multidrug transporter EmrE-like cation transporter